MATETKIKAPAGAKLEVTVLIDQDLWDELKEQGCSDADIKKSIEKSITFTDTVHGNITTPPVFYVESATLQKYY